MTMTGWDAAAYVQRSGLQQAMAAQVLSLLHLEGTERVLDIGCGDGRVTADARSLPFREEFDLIVSFNALHSVPEQDAALHSIRCALKPNGLAQLRFVPDGKRKSLELVIEDTCRSSK
ncbi:MAG: class I SAM-dependent methyltransferase [Bryobacteraceae bacterium]